MSSPAVEDPPSTEETAAAASVEPPADELYCPECGYNLHALESIGRCPECGLTIDRAGFARSRIPWVHRRHLGRIRAYWRTLWLAILKPGTIAAEASRRVDYRDAQKFRFVTAFVAAVSVIAGLVGAMVWYGSAAIYSFITPATIPGWGLGTQASPMFDLVIPWDAGATWPPVVPLAALLTSVLVTGVASYWFHPRSISVVRQNRAIALSYYACAPMTMAFIPLLTLVAVAVLREAGVNDPAKTTWEFVRDATHILNIFAAFSGFVVLAATWRSTMTILSRTTHPGTGRFLLAGALIPVTWVLCAALSLVAFPWAVGFVRLVIGSLR